MNSKSSFFSLPPSDANRGFHGWQHVLPDPGVCWPFLQWLDIVVYRDVCEKHLELVGDEESSRTRTWLTHINSKDACRPHTKLSGRARRVEMFLR